MSPGRSNGFPDPPGPATLDPPDAAELDGLEGDAFDDYERGLVLLDGDGVVKQYNRTEGRMSGWRPNEAVGLNFFSQVAPCTDVPEFRGRFRQGVESGALDLTFLFEFNFVMQPVRVAVWIVASSLPGRYWLATQVVERLKPSRNKEAERLLTADRLDLDLREVDHEVCAQEAIQFAGEIQSEGALVVLDERAERVVSASANLGEYLDIGDAPPVGRLAEELLTDEVAAQARWLAEAAPASDPAHPKLVRFVGRDLRLLGRLHRWNDRVFCEIFASDDDAGLDTVDRLTRWIPALHEANGRNLLTIACEALADLSGFSRIMAYRFDADYNGEVVAEVGTGELEPLLGLRFPASDIPPQARQLYVYNPTRFCSNTDATPVPLVSVRDEPDIDLSYCRLRTFSPYHLQYQRNLGVSSFYSLSLRRRGRLLGLLLGHHPRPARLGAWHRSALATIAATTEICLGAMHDRVFREQRDASSRGFGGVLRSLATWQPPEPPPPALLASLREQFGADGVGVISGDTTFSEPAMSSDDLRAMFAAAHDTPEPLPAECHCLADDWPELAERLPGIGGFLVFGTEPDRSFGLVLWRHHRDKEVVWARSPKAMPGAIRRWVEARERAAEPWSEMEMDLAEQLQTAILRAFEPLWVARGFLAQTLRLDPSAILIVEDDGTVEGHNQTALDLLDLAPDELNGRSTSDLISGWRREVASIEEAQVRAASGETFPARVETTRAEVLGRAKWVVYLLDLRPVRQLERQLREARHLESIGTLAAGLAHDFNNCLAVVQANAELLSRREGLRDSEPLDDLLAASRSGQALASDLLTFTRIGDDGATVDLAETVRGARRLLEVLVGSSVRLGWSLPREPLEVRGRRSEIHQILFNLVTNARDAMDGHGRIEVRLRRSVERGAGWAVLEVEDDGPGMNESVRSRVFDAFFTTKPRGGGTGLGLSQSRDLVHRAGGELDVRSVEGEGSVFRLRWPLAGDDPGASESVRGGTEKGSGSEGGGADSTSGSDAGAAPMMPASKLDGVQVLLVEDRSDLRKVYVELLSGMGCSVRGVESAELALEQIDEGAVPEVVVTDYSLEGMSGAGLIRRLADRQGMGFLLVTGLHPADDLGDLDAPLQILRKPVPMDELASALERIVDRIRSA